MKIGDNHTLILDEFDVENIRKAADLGLIAWAYRKRLRKHADKDIQDMLDRISDEDFAVLRKAAKLIKFSGLWNQWGNE